MFRWLLIFVLICQAGLPQSRGDCRAPQGAQAACCQMNGTKVKQPEVLSCCRSHSDGNQGLERSDSNEGGLHQPCCGCCHIAPIALLFETAPQSAPETLIVSLKLIDELMVGISHSPSTPPPNLLA